MNDRRSIVMDVESYFTLSGAGMPGNRGYYTSDPSKTPDEIKFRQEEKFPTKVMIWARDGASYSILAYSRATRHILSTRYSTFDTRAILGDTRYSTYYSRVLDEY